MSYQVIRLWLDKKDFCTLLKILTKFLEKMKTPEKINQKNNSKLLFSFKDEILRVILLILTYLMARYLVFMFKLLAR